MSYINNDTFYFFEKAQDLGLEKALDIFLTLVLNSQIHQYFIWALKNVLDKSFSLQHRNFNENIFWTEREWSFIYAILSTRGS